MKTETFVIPFTLKNVSFEILSHDSNKESIRLDEFEFVNQKKPNRDKKTRFIPIKLTKKEILKAHECQKVMLNFAFRKYKESIGTENEISAKRFYNDALIDYDSFVTMYKKELS